MIQKTKLALGIAATLGVAVLTATPASADELSNLKARIAKLENVAASKAAVRDNGNMVFFRTGYAGNDMARNEYLINIRGLNGNQPASKDGWYFGAGFDFRLSEDAFGFHDGTEILAELMFEYKEFDRLNSAANPLGTVVASATDGAPAGVTADGIVTHADFTTGSVSVTQFTLTASPKIKFMKGSKFRPWVAPVGFALHVISPPSEGVTVLEPSMHFAIGADYNLWKNIYVGADFRYNLTFGKTLDGTDVDGLTTGAYLGIGF